MSGITWWYLGAEKDIRGIKGVRESVVEKKHFYRQIIWKKSEPTSSVCLNKNYSLTRSSSSLAKQFLKDKYNLLSWMKFLDETVLKLRSWLQNSIFSDAFEHPVVFQEQHPLKRMFLLQCHNQCQPYGIDHMDNKNFTCELFGGTVSNAVAFHGCCGCPTHGNIH